MLSRNILKKLSSWAEKPGRKPLVIRGAKQVGKTTAVEMFSQNFSSFIHLNLERRGESNFFTRGLSPDKLLQAVKLAKNVFSGENGQTLLFIDEIQQSPQAVEMLRWFYEDMPELHVIAAGSLLEAMLDREQINFPVGRVEFLCMHPLNFSEFLSAMGEEIALETLDTIPFPSWAVETLLAHYTTYTLLGGMPEIIARFSQNRDITALSDIYQSLFTSLLDDIPKYAKNHSQARVMRHCLESAPFEAGKRVTLAGFGKSDYRSRETGEALKTLERAMLLHLIYPSTAIELPAILNKRKSPRLQFLDTGLMNYAAGLQKEFFSTQDLHSLYRGILAEHITCQEFIADIVDMQHPPLFWVREKPQANAEVDYLFTYKQYLVPVEIKSGKSGTLRSLHQFMDMCPHTIAVRLYSGPVDVSDCTTTKGKKFRLLSLPLFAVSKIRQHIDWAFS